MGQASPSVLLASVESYLGRGGVALDNADALVRQLSLLFSITADDAAPEDLSRYDEVFTSLADRVDAEARGFLALQLSVSLNAPRGIVRKLAGDVIAVARPILIHSPLLDDEALVEIARQQGLAHMQAIAERDGLNVVVTDVLILEGDDTVRRRVAGNLGADLSSGGLRRLSQQALDDEQLETALGQRSDVPEIIIRFLVRRGAGAKRRLPEDTGAVAPARVIGRLDVPARSIDDWYAVYDFDAAARRVEALAGQGLIGEPLLTRLVAEERFPEAVLVLARLIGVRVGTMVAWMTAERPEHFLAAAKATRVGARAVFALLNIGPWRQMLDGRRRQEIIRAYQALDPAIARKQLDRWRFTPARVISSDNAARD